MHSGNVVGTSEARSRFRHCLVWRQGPALRHHPPSRRHAPGSAQPAVVPTASEEPKLAEHLEQGVLRRRLDAVHDVVENMPRHGREDICTVPADATSM